MQSNVKWLSRPIKYLKVALASSSLVPTIEHKCLFLLSIVFQTNNADYSKNFACTLQCNIASIQHIVFVEVVSFTLEVRLQSYFILYFF